MIEKFVDATIFMGMQSVDRSLRIACKNYFVDRYYQTIAMSDEQAGKCDRIVWQYPREVQDIYYPFMDRLRTDMKIQGLPYESEDVAIALHDKRLDGLTTSQKLTLGMTIARKGKLYTIDKVLLELNKSLTPDDRLPIFQPEISEEKNFPDEILEECYQQSLSLKINSAIDL
jgi:hypothetical protein